MASDNLFFIADSGEVYAGIPALQYIDVYRYTFVIFCGELLLAGWGKKRLQQFDDASHLHFEGEGSALEKVDLSDASVFTETPESQIWPTLFPYSSEYGNSFRAATWNRPL